MRRVAVATALVLIVSACGSPADDTLPGSESSSTTSSASSTTPPTPTSTADHPSSTSTISTTPGERPTDQEGLPTDESPNRLSIEDALLPDDAFPAPWEPQRRNLDAAAFDVGPNQTDCDEYWAYEQLLAGGGGHVMWWIDGGNANHRVTRVADMAEALPSLMEVATIADECPVVRWNEGGEFTTEAFVAGDAAFIMRFGDEGSGEVTWVAVTLWEDLVSVLRVPLWTSADGTMIEFTLDDMTALAKHMRRLLEAAGPERTPPPAPTLPPLPNPTTTDPQRPMPPLPNSTTTDPQRPMPPLPSSTLAPSGLGELLLTDGEAIDGWSFIQIDSYDPGGGDDELVEACPPAASFDVVDQVLTWEADFQTSSGGAATQIIGEMPDRDSAVRAVEQFGLVADCDLDVVIAGAVASGGAVSIPDADAAATVFIEITESLEARLELGVVAVGSIVSVLTLETDITADEPGAELIEFMTRATAKIAAG